MKKIIFLLIFLIATQSAVAESEKLNQVFISTTTWIVPQNTSNFTVIAIGAGGGGGGVGTVESGGAGGGAGGSVAIKNNFNLVAGTNYTITVGSPGIGVVASKGNNGTDSWFINNTFVLAKGGEGGFPNASGLGGNVDISLSIGDIVYKGGNGGSGGGLGTSGGQGGSGAGDKQNGTNGITTSIASLGARSLGGGGSRGRTTDGTGFSEGRLVGGSGGGSYCDGACTARAGGGGTRGEVRLSYLNNSVNTDYPYVRDFYFDADNIAVGKHNASIPINTQLGDLLIMIISVGTSGATPTITMNSSNWTQLFVINDSTDANKLIVFYQNYTGDYNANFTTSTSQMASYIVYSIANADASNIFYNATSSTATGLPGPPALFLDETSKYLWLAIGAQKNQQISGGIIGQPVNFTSFISLYGGNSGAALASSQLKLETNTVDPLNYSALNGGIERWTAATIAISAPSSAPPDPCAYTSGDWTITDVCTISSNVNLGNNNLYCLAGCDLTITANITNYNLAYIHTSGGAKIFMTSGGGFK